MHRRSLVPILIVMLSVLATLGPLSPGIAEAHQSGCHRWHSCPSDTGSYVCGDLGYDDYCPNKTKPKQTPAGTLPALPAGNSTQPTIPRKAGEPPFVDWRTFNIDTRFGRYWQENGGLPVFGYAKSLLHIRNGFFYQVFERNRLESHPENRAPYNVQLGLLGEERLLQLGRVWQNEPQAAPQAKCRFFAETGHNLCEPFLSYWRTHGLEFDGRKGTSETESLALFGYPITEAVPEVGTDGVTRVTQWFQRARFEDHNAEGAGILLGLLGNEMYNQ